MYCIFKAHKALHRSQTSLQYIYGIASITFEIIMFISLLPMFSRVVKYVQEKVCHAYLTKGLQKYAKKLIPTMAF